jgi:hypothetical protein
MARPYARRWWLAAALLGVGLGGAHCLEPARDPLLFDASPEALDRAAWIGGAVVRCYPPAPLSAWPRYTVGSEEAGVGRHQEYVSFGKSLREPIIEFVTARRSGAYRFAMPDPDHPNSPLGALAPRVRLFDATWRDATPGSVVVCDVVPVPSGTVWVGVEPRGGPRSRVFAAGCGQWNAQLGDLGGAWLTLPAGRCSLRLERRRIGRTERGPEVAVVVREGETQYITLPAPPPVTERSPLPDGLVQSLQEQISEFERVGNQEAAESLQRRLADYQGTGDPRALHPSINPGRDVFDTGEVPIPATSPE